MGARPCSAPSTRRRRRRKHGAEQDTEQGTEQDLSQNGARGHARLPRDGAAPPQLGQPSTSAAFHIPDALCRREIEADFVAIRQCDPTVDQARLHLALNVALGQEPRALRAIGRSFAVELERARAARVLLASTAPKARHYKLTLYEDALTSS